MHAVLLDTHVWIWLLNNDRERISGSAMREIETAAVTNSLAVSEISLWEVATKAAKGKLELTPDSTRWLERATKAPGIGVVEIARNILVDSASIELREGDPADRILVATARNYGLRLATADRVLIEFAKQHRKLRVLDVRK